MTKVEVTVPNDFHFIIDCEYDRDVLRSFKWKWATVPVVKKIAAGWTTDDVCLIAGMTGDFYFSTLATFSIDPTNHLFVYRRLLLNVKRPAFETYPFLLSSSEFKMRGAVPPQTQIPPCRIKESPPKILISNPYYVHTEFQFSASSVSENKRVRSINPLNTELNPICHLLVLLGELTFLGTCIVSIFQYISNKMQRYTVYAWKLLYMFRVEVPPETCRALSVYK